MAGSRKWFEYTADNGDVFAIEMDESNGEAVGNTDYVGTSTAVYALPRNVLPRVALYRSADGNVNRRIPVTDSGASAATLPATIDFDVSGVGTVTCSLSSFFGERFKRIPIAIDTGLDDGDEG